MIAAEVSWTIAYCAFLCGAAWSFRSNGAWGAVILMCGAITLDFSTAFLSRFGLPGFTYGKWESNFYTTASIVSGLAVVALLVLSVILRRLQAFRLFHGVIAVTQVTWFLSYIWFLYGLYVVK